MRVKADVDHTSLTGDHGGDVDSVQATCRRCKHTTESYGQGEASIRRCLVLRKEESPEGESNFYVDAEEVDD